LGTSSKNSASRSSTFALVSGGVNARSAAAFALGGIGPEAKEAVPALIKALGEDQDADVRKYAAWALEAITGQDFGEDAARWQRWFEEQK